MKTRRVGAFTLGASLIVFGLLFILRIFSIPISYIFIMKLWPIIFLFLGIEVLVSYFNDKEGKIIYDGGAIFLLFLLSVFAMGMGFMDLCFQFAQKY